MDTGKPPNITNQASPDYLDWPTDADLKEVRVIAEESARYFGARAHEIDEIAQDTLIKVWEQWNTPNMVRARQRRRLRWTAYIRKIAKNRQLDLVRSHARRAERQLQAGGVRPTGPPRPGVQRQNDEQGVDVMMHLVDRDQIIHLFNQLPERQRMVAQLIFVDELTPAEVAERFDADPQAIRKSLRAARARLIVLIRNELENMDTARDLEDA